MNELGSLLSYLRDPKLAAHATSALPAWLWSADATRVLWVNPVAAAIFDVASPAAIAGYTIDPKGSAALQIAMVRLEKRPAQMIRWIHRAIWAGACPR